MFIGIVGKPNCGKSTFFKAATLAEVEIANRPFVTIKPNSGIGYVKVDCVDKELNVKCNPREGFCLQHNRFVPIKILDVAGLVPGAHKGKGLGNQFLSDLNQADALVHIVDISGSVNERGEDVGALNYDPLNDIDFLEEELDMWYFQIIKKHWEASAKKIQQTNLNVARELAKQLSGLRVTEEMLEETLRKLNLPLIINWTGKDIKKLSSELRKKSKPMIITCNKIDIPGAEKNYERLIKKYPHLIAIKCSAEVELALREAAKKNLISYIPGESSFKILKNLNEKQKQGLDFIKTFLTKFKTTGVQEILNKAVFDILDYIAVFPGGVSKLADKDGNILPDCFLLKNNSTALEFAATVHTDLAKKFIKAMDVRTKKAVGKDHKLKHRDIIEIITSK